MAATTRLGLFKAWYEDLERFNTRIPREKCGPLPHLGVGAGLVTIFIGSFFASHLASALAIIVGYGPHAYFREGLHIIDWKHDFLSDGGTLSFTAKLAEVVFTLVFWAAMICVADFCSMCLQQLIRRNGRWLEVLLRSAGGAALIAFSAHLYRHGSWGIHPIPLSSLIGGAALIFKGLTLLFKTGRVPQVPVSGT